MLNVPLREFKNKLIRRLNEFSYIEDKEYFSYLSSFTMK